MKIGSLFSGIGGIEIGFEKQGFTTEWFVEYDPYAQAVLRKHWPGIPIYGDITTIDFIKVPRVDILTGGFPCQDISNAGKRAGIIEGKRSSLWKYYLKAIREIRPGYAVIENVSALTNRGLWVVLADLAKEGYDAEWTDIRASDVGAPHRRERIFIVAYPNKSRLDRGIINPFQEGYETFREGWDRPQCVIKSDGNNQRDVADPQRQRCDAGCDNEREHPNSAEGQHNEEAEQLRQGFRSVTSESSYVSNPNIQRWEGRGKTEIRFKELWDGWWAAEPDVGRVANGIPFRVDRIKCLGNAVVPQVAEVIAKAINEWRSK
jgi:DNA (cytosine-5)-methyltransferase 1